MTVKYFLPALLVTAAVSCRAQSPLKTKEVFMYKNGFTYVHQQGDVSTQNGGFSLYDKQIPEALFGTIWFQSPSGISRVIRKTDSIEKPDNNPMIQTLFALNLGKKVKITNYLSKENAVIEGTISKVFSGTDGNTEPGHYNPCVALVQTSTGMVMITEQMINSAFQLEFENGSQFNAVKKYGRNTLWIEFKKPGKTDQLNMVYMLKHESWSPSYRLVLTGDKKAHLYMNAEVKSGDLDLEKSDLNLVVASPELYAANMYSALSGLANLAPYFEKAAYLENSVARGFVDDVAQAVEPLRAGDYFVYKIKDFQLQKNQAAWLEIQEGDVDFEQYFGSSLPEVNEYTGVNATENFYDVYHMIRFTNNLKQPLTAAPVVVETTTGGGNAVLSQPILPTTAVGGKCLLNVARSFDLPLSHSETEKSRVANARINETKVEVIRYDNVNMEGKIQVENKGDKEVTMKVTRVIYGKPLNSSSDWTTVSMKPRFGSPNQGFLVTWEFKIKPGEQKNITYSYEFLLRTY